jgi:hypothetical protein
MDMIDEKLIQDQLQRLIISKRRFVIGIDVNGKIHSYVLTMQENDKTLFILLCSTMTKKKKFWKEVNNLAKYFNAEIIKEV